MTDSPDKLPDLEGELSRKDLLRHLIAGNAVGYVVAYGTFDRLEFERFEGPGALGKAVTTRCVEINNGIPEAEMDIGADFTFYPVGEDSSEEDFEFDERYDDQDFVSSPLALGVDDARHLLAHLPVLFLNQTTTQEE